MGWFGLLGGLIGTITGLASDSRTQRKSDELLRQVEEDKKKREEETTWTAGKYTYVVAPTKDILKVTPDYSAPLWEDPYPGQAAIDMENKIKALGSQLPALYEAIDFQPVEDGYALIYATEGPEYANFIIDGDSLEKYKQDYFGMDFRPQIRQLNPKCPIDDYYNFGFVSEQTIIYNTPKNTTVEELTKTFGNLMWSIGLTLNTLREFYIRPNLPRFIDWCKNELPKYNCNALTIQDLIKRHVISLDNPTNDVVYRTMQQKQYYDEVTDRIMAISDRMCHYAINFFMLMQRKQPTRAFYDPYYNKYTYGTWKAKDKCWEP